MKSRLLLVLAVGLGLAVLGRATTISETPAHEPKLVVTIIVDQLRYDYLERFRLQFQGGFKRLLEGGAFMTSAHYDYFPTVTGPGHASFLSGAGPAVHGIIGNDWFDRRLKKNLYCVGDENVKGVGTESPLGQMSPRNFIGNTVADELRLARPKGKVIGLSIKDRGAILPAGKRPMGAYWFESASGHFITSTYYLPQLPAWVQEFNARKLPASYVGQKWERLLDATAYQWPDEGPGEGKLSGEKTVSFPHTIAESKTEGFETVIPTPFGNQLLLELAKAAIEAEQLGRSPQTDLLHLSFSSNDYVGHRFGPYSQEAQDVTLRLDRQLGELFAFLEEKVGMHNVLVALSADHGVAPQPEFAAYQGLDGIREDTFPLMAELLGKVAERFGPGNYFLKKGLTDGALYFDFATLQQKQLEPAVLENFIRDWAYGTGVFVGAFTRQQLLAGQVPSAIGQRVLRGYHPERSGDIVLIAKPFTLLGKGNSGTTHGSPYSYDTHIPVLFLGRAFRPGRYAEEFHITDIAPTLCAALHIEQPAASIGKPCPAILADQGPAAASTAVPAPTARPRQPLRVR